MHTRTPAHTRTQTSIMGDSPCPNPSRCTHLNVHNFCMSVTPQVSTTFRAGPRTPCLRARLLGDTPPQSSQDALAQPHECICVSCVLNAHGRHQPPLCCPVGTPVSNSRPLELFPGLGLGTAAAAEPRPYRATPVPVLTPQGPPCSRDMHTQGCLVFLGRAWLLPSGTPGSISAAASLGKASGCS
jgi:hypothetical protein